MDNKYKVVFSSNCCNCYAFFNSVTDCQVFAELMAKDGRLIRVTENGKDTTRNYITVVTMAELMNRK
jgi:hypothetical protein